MAFTVSSEKNSAFILATKQLEKDIIVLNNNAVSEMFVTINLAAGLLLRSQNVVATARNVAIAASPY